MAYTVLVLWLIVLSAVLLRRGQTGSHSTIEAEKRELNELLDEARLVKNDLEELLQEMVKTSEQLVRQAEKRFGQENLPSLEPVPQRQPERKQAGFKEIKTATKPASQKPKKNQKPSPDHRLLAMTENIGADGRGLERYGPMYRLAEQGLSVREIAQTLNLGQGEVELVLALRKKRYQV